MATWHAADGLATDARYDVYDGDSDPSPVTVLVDQTVPPDSSVYAGWKVLATRDFQSTDKLVKVSCPAIPATPWLPTACALFRC